MRKRIPCKGMIVLALFLLSVYLVMPDIVSGQKSQTEDPFAKLVGEAENAFYSGDYAQAAAKYEQALALPESAENIDLRPTIHLKAGICWLEQGIRDKAKAHFFAAIAARPAMELDAEAYSEATLGLFEEAREELYKIGSAEAREQIQAVRQAEAKRKAEAKKETEARLIQVKVAARAPVKVRKKIWMRWLLAISAVTIIAAVMIYKRNRKGAIQVNSDPAGARIFLDGIETGKTTNAKLEKVTQGPHTIKLTLPSFDDYSTAVTVKGGDTADLSVDFHEKSTSSTIFEFAGKWGSPGTGEGQLSEAVGIAVDNNGYVYVSDRANNVVQKFTSSGAFVGKWGGKGSEDGKFTGNCGIAADYSGYIYVCDYASHRIQKFTSSGEFVKSAFGTYASSESLFQPGAICIDHSDSCYIQDCGNSRIIKTNLLGYALTSWSYPVGVPGQPGGTMPVSGIAFRSGNLYIIDSANYQIHNFNTQMSTYYNLVISRWGSYGDQPGQFKCPHGLEVDAQGNVYVTDIVRCNVQKFKADGTFIASWGSQGYGDGQFICPYEIAIDQAGYAYVADKERVQKFRIK